MKNKVKELKIKNNIQLGKITYSDIHRVEKPLFSHKYKIVGKPDYIVEKKGYKIPVELKTGYCSYPKNNHIYQLAAYCHLIEDNYGNFVPYGMLIYNNYLEFKIPFNPKVRFELENIINNMRYSLKYKNISRNHNDSNKCFNCSFKKHCTHKII